MATPLSVTSGTTSASNTSSTSSTSASNASSGVQDIDDPTLTPAAKAKAQLNAAIVQASLTVSLQSSNDPQSLVLKTALTGINEALKADFGDNAIQNAVSQDNTPEGTAGRIVALSTGFYEAFKAQHPGEDDDAVLSKFMDTIKGGMDKGFKEARDILDGLGVLNGDLASNIDKTYDLVQQGYADFVAAHSSKSAAAADDGAGTSGGSGASSTSTASAASASVKVAVSG